MSLTTEACDKAENRLKIIDNQPVDGVKKMFGVCVKQIYFPDRFFGFRFIEWVHMTRLLGADKIYLRNRFVHPDIYEVIKYFEETGYIENQPFLEPTGLPDEKRSRSGRSLEVAILNDCFYSNKNLYEFIVIIDTDEVIMPMNEEDRSWFDVFDKIRLEDKSIDSYISHSRLVPEVLERFNPEFPEYHHILQYNMVG